MKYNEDGLLTRVVFRFDNISSLERDTIEIESRNKEIIPKLKHKNIALLDFFSNFGIKEKKVDFIDNIFLIT